MHLGKKLAKALLGIAGTLLVGVAGAVGVAAFTGAAIPTLAAAHPWEVTVGDASRTLAPGLEATMTYEIKSTADRSQVLHGTTVEFKNDGVGMYDTRSQRYVDDCPVSWFRTAANTVPTGVAVGPGGSVNGAVVIAFDQHPVPQSACENIGIDVIVTAD